MVVANVALNLCCEEQEERFIRESEQSLEQDDTQVQEPGRVVGRGFDRVVEDTS